MRIPTKSRYIVGYDRGTPSEGAYFTFNSGGLSATLVSERRGSLIMLAM